MKIKGVPLAVLVLLLLDEAADAFAQFCFKKTSLLVGRPELTHLADVAGFVLGVAQNPYFWLGLVTVTVVLVSWLVVLSKVDLSVAIPLTSISYVFVALTSKFFLHEDISLVRWCGILLILVGVTCVSLSSGHGGKEAR